MTVQEHHPIQLLSDSLGRDWPAITRARSDSLVFRRAIADEMKSKIGRLDSDVDLVVFGSLAREEWTSGSDIDWTLLIDGQATPDHQMTVQEVRKTIEDVEVNGKKLPKPGMTGVFGSMTFSHDLIHLIGGDADSNHNMTRRILLLLESHAIEIDGNRESRAFARTTRAILNRYLQNDGNLFKGKTTVPRFLMNDFVRYWRTLCVDFAWKEWEQSGDKWALRNIKLRMSRKMLFVSALLRVFACGELPQGRDETAVFSELIHSLYHPPLQVVARILTQCGLEESAGQLFDHYNAFLQIIDNASHRSHLEKLSPHKVYDDELFMTLRSISHEFQNVIAEVFFGTNSPLARFTHEYGVF